MAKFVMTKEITDLPTEQQEKIRNVLVKSGLLNEAGEVNDYKNISQENKDIVIKALNETGVKQDLLGNPFVCAAARVAEAAAVIACGSVGGPILVAACIATAHEVANKACE